MFGNDSEYPFAVSAPKTRAKSKQSKEELQAIRRRARQMEYDAEDARIAQDFDYLNL